MVQPVVLARRLASNCSGGLRSTLGRSSSSSHPVSFGRIWSSGGCESFSFHSLSFFLSQLVLLLFYFVTTTSFVLFVVRQTTSAAKLNRFRFGKRQPGKTTSDELQTRLIGG